MNFWRAINVHPKLMAASAVICACLYVACRLDRGWIPHDEGQLGQSAERVLSGELPHRDFDDMYTGGLTFLNALAFRWFGVDSLSLRWMLALWFVPTIAAYYYIASRAAPPPVAAGITLLGAMFSLPVYSAPMPSWYNLFLAILGTAALVRYIETEHRRWLFTAGLCGGASLLFKITGLYFVAAGLLLLTFREQLQSQPDPRDSELPRRDWYRWLLTIGLAAFAALGLAFLRAGSPPMNAIHFTLPIAAASCWLIYHEHQARRGPSWRRLRRLTSFVTPFAMGVFLPVAGFAAFYASHHALESLYHGVFVLPRLRAESGAFPLPGPRGLLAALPLTAVLGGGLFVVGGKRKRIENAVLVGLVALLAVSGTEAGFFFGLHAVRNIMPLVVAIGLGILLTSDRLKLSAQQKQYLYLTMSAAVLCSLVQYPHAYGIYFFYAAPMALLAVLFIAAYQPAPWRKALTGALVFYLAFAALRLNGPDPHANVAWLGRVREAEPMGLTRCSLIVAAEEAAAYRGLVAAIQAHSEPGSRIYATPDCPEVYFLSNRVNPTGVMYEFFRPELLADHCTLLQMLDAENVNVVVVNGYPGFSQRVDSRLLAAISERFNHMHPILMDVGPGIQPIERFRVYWRP
jgi:hypothetical protein